MKRLEGKVALIIGAGTGVGRSCMSIFAAEGAKVLGAGRTAATLEESVLKVRSEGGDAHYFVADASSEEDCNRLAEEAIARHGRIDILVHAAGVGYSWAQKSPNSMNAVTETPLDKWREVMGINLDAYFLTSRAVIPHMIKAGGGAVVAVSSISGFLGAPVAHAYCASKAGMINLTRAMCVAYAQHNIRVNCIAPGFIDTPMIADVVNAFDDPVMADQLSPMRRPGTPDEMARGCLYLASDEASYCNGSVLVIDGGISARS